MERCVRCGEEGEDRRTLRMDCFYDMKELGIPFENEMIFKPENSVENDVDHYEVVQNPKEVELPGGQRIVIGSAIITTTARLRTGGLYTLRVCKECRGEWLAAISDWFKKPKPEADSCGSGIFVRRNGATVEITEEEWFRLNPDREPFRVRPNAKTDSE